MCVCVCVCVCGDMCSFIISRCVEGENEEEKGRGEDRV